MSGFLLLGVSLLLLDLYIPRFVFTAQSESLQRQLASNARMLAAELPAKPEQLEAWTKEAGRRSDSRITILGRDGAMLADSAQFAPNEEFLAVTIPLSQPGPGTTLRLAASLEPLRAQIAGLSYRLVAVSLAIVTLAVALAIGFRTSQTRRAAALSTYTERLLDPQVFQEIPAGGDELGLVGQALRRMAPKIRELVESLQLESARRESILASMVEGVLAVDQDLRVIFCNHSFARTVGARIPLKPGIGLLELVRDPALLEIMNKVLASGERVEDRLTLSAADAHTFDVLAGPLAGASTRGALAILHDVTKLDRLERVRKDFVANVSHELRTPLAAIQGYAETLLEGALNDGKHNRRFVQIIQAQAMRLGNIASDLLTLSELETVAEAAQEHPVSLAAALESAIRTVESAARTRGVRLVCGQIDDIPVAGRQLRLEQVFVNLLDNAIKFNREHGEVRVEAVALPDAAQVTIADTGIGIPSEDLPRIFERFYRVDKARSREMGGTGLGLSIVKHAIELMGGTVSVESRLGEGSRFVLWIPAAGMNQSNHGVVAEPESAALS